MPADPKPRRHPIPEPLQLGRGESTHLQVREVKAKPNGQVLIVLPEGQSSLRLTERGAIYLADWLLSWARPNRRWKLWSARDIQRELGISSATLVNWQRKPDFPAPVAVTAAGAIWEERPVRDWALQRPKPGRPRNS